LTPDSLFFPEPVPVPRAKAARPFPAAALVPAALAVGAVLVTAALGLVQRSAFGTALEDRFYGFFFDRYPLFAFAVVYGAARIGLAALEPGPRRALRLAGGAFGLALFVLACFHPTFGGLVLRPAFMTGGMGFLTGQTMAGAYLMGAAAAAFAYGAALGLGVALARLRPRVGWRPLAWGAAGFLALWWGALVLGSPRALGLDWLGPWPRLPLAGSGALAAAGLVALAVAPHALLHAVRRMRGGRA
jgi:hypothetical protein